MIPQLFAAAPRSCSAVLHAAGIPVWLAVALPAAARGDDMAFFEEKVRPVLARRCLSCPWPRPTGRRSCGGCSSICAGCRRSQPGADSTGVDHQRRRRDGFGDRRRDGGRCHVGTLCRWRQVFQTIEHPVCDRGIAGGNKHLVGPGGVVGELGQPLRIIRAVSAAPAHAEGLFSACRMQKQRVRPQGFPRESCAGRRYRSDRGGRCRC